LKGWKKLKKNFRTVHGFGQDEIIINKSRFIGYATTVDTEEEAQAFVAEIKEKHKDATHNVYAYMVGESSNIQRYSDDGEPSGTAGIPILELLKKEDLKNVAVVVTRYFGGIKLGAGGLVRAYIKGAKCGLESARVVEKVMYSRMRIRLDYTLYGKVENELMNLNYRTENIAYDDAVNLDILCRSEEYEGLIGKLKDLTSANMEYSLVEESYMSELDGELID
jgi:uncharacterized YigZ family protein